MTLAVGHLREGAIGVLDAVLEVRPPFDPEVAVAECTATLSRFGDHPGYWRSLCGRVAEGSLCRAWDSFEQSARPKSDLYYDMLPLLNARRVELLDNPRLSAQLVGLERRTLSGRGRIDHSPGGHDDLANVVAGVLVGLDIDRRPALVRQADMLDAGQPIILPDAISTFLAVLSIDKGGMCASVRAAKTLYGECSLIILDFDAGPLHHGALKGLTDFGQFATRCRNGTLAVVPEGFAVNGSFNGCVAIEIVDGRLPELQLLAAARWIHGGAVKLGSLAQEKARLLPFGAALDFRAGENVDDPLRCAILTAIAISLEVDNSALKVGKVA